jgi:ATP-binding cassette subfamily B protein
VAGRQRPKRQRSWIFGLGDYLSQQYDQISTDIYMENKSLVIRKAIVGSDLNLISTGGYYGAYVVVLAKTVAGALSVGTFTFLTGAFSRSRSYIERILSGFNDISEQAVFLKDLFEFFEMEPAIRPHPAALTAPRSIRTGFEFRNVAFAYAGSDRQVVRNINFRLEPSGKIGANWRERGRKDDPG